MFIEKSTKEFLDLLAAKKSVPGGGGAAALAGSLAAALTSMVCNFTVDKKGYEESQSEIIQILEEAEKSRNELTELIELDAIVFNELMAVYKMPKDTDEDKAARNKALTEKAKNAANVPMRIAILALAVQKIALISLKKGNKDLSSDAILAGILGRVALRSASYNVLINLNLVKDLQYNENMKNDLKVMLDEAEQLEKELMTISEKIFPL